MTAILVSQHDYNLNGVLHTVQIAADSVHVWTVTLVDEFGDESVSAHPTLSDAGDAYASISRSLVNAGANTSGDFVCCAIWDWTPRVMDWTAEV